jgi:hypothetical protein
MWRFLSRLWGDQRGAAFSESVIMMPVLLIVWGGIVYTHDRYSDTIENASENRGCVMAGATSGCRGSAGAGCGGTGGGTFSLADTISELFPGFDTLFNFIKTIFRFLSDFLDRIDTVAWAQKARSIGIDFPGILGGASFTVDDVQQFLCSEKKMSHTDVLWGLFCQIAPPFC